MATRRGFLAGLLATTLLPSPTWADAGNPHYLAAAKHADGSYRLYGLDAHGQTVFDMPLPDRGHAAAAHPTRPEVVAFARRPGTFAIVIDCLNKKITTKLNTPAGRHFYGHGAFSAYGSLLFTTENDYEAGQGLIGVWDVTKGYQRVGEFASGGIGPHEILRLPQSDVLVVANGGIDTHPDTGRTKLNLSTMTPNLTYVGIDGAIVEQISLPPELHQNSIRHLAVQNDGLIAFVMQWQGELGAGYPLLGLHRSGTEVQLLRAPLELHIGMRGYGASVAFSGDDQKVAFSSSTGGQVQIFNVASGDYQQSYFATDVSGLSKGDDGFTVSAGTGEIVSLNGVQPVWRTRHSQSWDNHLISIPAMQG
ncbi:MAG: DUF1513 domain-containing protein [Paracoccaceae bacterium]